MAAASTAEILAQGAGVTYDDIPGCSVIEFENGGWWVVADSWRERLDADGPDAAAAHFAQVVSQARRL